MKVKARAGVVVPREDNPRRYVPTDTALDVPESAYYLRRISDGDLIRVTEDVNAAASKATAKAAAVSATDGEK